MRVLISSTPGIGHVQPMLPLALQLRDRGHDVLWATGRDGCEWVRAAGLAAAPTGLRAEERMAEYRLRWPEAASLRGDALADHMFPRLFGAITARAAFPDLLAVAREHRPEVVVSEAADLAAPIVAAGQQVPQVTHGFGAVVPKERVQAAADETADLWREVGREPRPFGGCYDHLYLDIYPPSFAGRDLPHIPRLQRVRPGSLTAVPGEEVPAEIRQLLTSDRTIVYMTFGTVFNTNPAFTAAVAGVARMPDVSTVVTVGPQGDPRMFGDLPEHVIVTTYVPQNVLLPRCAVVVSHAGSGTLLGALALGVPQVCLPQAADQFRNAAACSTAGAGISLIGDDVTEASVEAAVRRAMSDVAFRHAANRLAEEIASMPTVEHAAVVIEQLAVSSAVRDIGDCEHVPS